MLDAPKRLLFVGNKPLLAELRDWLFSEGYESAFCPDATCTRHYIKKHGIPHLLLLTLNLPDVGALTLSQEILAMADVPIITMATVDTPGLAAKALQYSDDYVRLPVDPDELLMRIRRILSRIHDFSYAAGPLFKVCDHMVVDYVNRHVVVRGERKKLTPIENTLLQILLKHRGNVVVADTLIERVWRAGARIGDRNSLRVHMHRLRRKIERDPDEPSMILTERGVGYVFICCK